MRTIIMTGCFIFISLAVFSQSTSNNQFNKGYYSIGNKSRILVDLDRSNMIRDRYVPDPSFQSAKGYYSPDARKNKIPWRLVRGESRGYLVPVVTKGYYSIGRNAEQLRK